MKIMGVDPGTARVGWAVIEDRNLTEDHLLSGCIETPAGHPMPERLLTIHDRLSELISEHAPDCVSVEELYFATNAKTAIAVGQARGVILYTAQEHRLPVVSYTPLVVKQAVTGNGKAGKTEVEKMVLRIMKMKIKPRVDDITDAIAIALTHAYSYKFRRQII